MWGAIIGDIAGSTYEFNQIKKVKPVDCTKIITERGFYSDDTILTVAIANAVEENKDYETYLKKYSKRFETYRPDFKPYFKTSFSPGFLKWANGQTDGNSIGNGAMMRISPIGYMFNSENEVIENAILATKPSHNSQEAIECSKIVALIIYLSRQGWPKEEIIKKLNINLQYKPFERFNTTCSETIGNCLYALFKSNSFDESLRTIISFGGDTDTNACIVGAMAEAMYGIDKKHIEKAKKKIPKEFTDIIEKEYKTKKRESFER